MARTRNRTKRRRKNTRKRRTLGGSALTKQERVLTPSEVLESASELDKSNMIVARDAFIRLLGRIDEHRIPEKDHIDRFDHTNLKKGKSDFDVIFKGFTARQVYEVYVILNNRYGDPLFLSRMQFIDACIATNKNDEYHERLIASRYKPFPQWNPRGSLTLSNNEMARIAHSIVQQSNHPREPKHRRLEHAAEAQAAEAQEERPPLYLNDPLYLTRVPDPDLTGFSDEQLAQWALTDTPFTFNTPRRRN